MCEIDGCIGGKPKTKELCEKHYMRLRRTGSTDDPQPRAKHSCLMDGCGGQCVGDGLCRKHYMRKNRHGDPNVTLYQRDEGPDETRWMAKVEVQSPGCWVWQTGLTEGYGAYSKGGKSTTGHAYVYELLVGPVPEGLELDHLCRVRACVNPDHLEPVTHAINHLRGSRGAGKKRPKRKELVMTSQV